MVNLRLKRPVAVAIACLVALAMALAGVVVQMRPAQAAIRPDINITITELVTINNAGTEQPNQVANFNSFVKMKFTWSAAHLTGAQALKDGDQFKIELPQHFIVKDESLTPELRTQGGLHVGDCALTTREFLCTFNANVQDQNDLHGDGFLNMKASSVNTETTSTFLINGTGQVVNNPANSPIIVYQGQYNPTTFRKSAPVSPNADATNIEWHIYFNITKEPLNYSETDTVNEIVIYEKVGGNHVFDDSKPVHLVQTSSPNQTGDWSILGNTDPNAHTTYPFTINKEVVTDPVQGEMLKFTITGPFDGYRNYGLKLFTKPTNNPVSITPGLKYENFAILNGVEVSNSTQYVLDAGISVSLKQGMGNIKLTKFLQGDAAASLSQDLLYKIRVNWTLPQNKTVGDYPDWTSKPVGFVGDNSATSGVVVAEIKSGNFTEMQFPVGTSIVIDEDMTGLPNNVLWGTAQITPSSVTIKNMKVEEVNVTNTATAGGTLKIRKAVEVDGVVAAAPGNQATFDVTVKCENEPDKTLQLPANGAEVDYGKLLPVGTSCTVEEVGANTASGNYTNETTYHVGDSATNAIVAKVSPDTMVVKNAYATKMGTFNIKKVVEGVAHADKTFEFKYTCGNGPEKSVSVPGNGVATPVGESFPLGTTCTVTEVAPADDMYPGYSLSAVPVAQTVEIKEAAETVTATFTNTYTKDVGSLSVKKVVAGDSIPGGFNTVDKKFMVQVNCGNGDNVRTLELPGNGDPVLFANDIPAGTKCTVGEVPGINVTPDTHSVAVTYSPSGEITIAKDDNVTATVTNTYTLRNASVLVKKVVQGVADVPAGTTFKVNYSCENPGVTTPVTGDVQVPANGAPVEITQGLQVGATCEILEDVDLAKVKFAGYTLESYTPKTTVIAQATPDPATDTHTITNRYKKDVGSLSVKKQVDGQFPVGFDQAAKVFKVKVDCAGFLERTLDVPGSGVPVTFSDVIPAGTVCTVAELADSGLPATHAVTTTYTPSANVTVAKDAQEEVTVKNAYSIKTGTFEVVKSVSGDDRTAAGKTFDFSYVCTNSVTGQDDITGTISAKGDGTPVPSNKQVPIGSKCTVTEVAASAALTGYTWTPTTPIELNIDTEGTSVRFEFVNKYTKDLGDLKVTKKVDAEDRFVPPADGFEITASCDDGTVKTEKLKHGESFTLTGLPTGTKCTITEENADVQGYARATTIGLEATPATPQNVVTIGKDTEVSVVVTNKYTPKTGDFSVTKKVTGDAGPLVSVDTDFQIEYTCTALDGGDGGSGSFTLKHGEIEQITGVREGTCTVTETGADVPNTDRTTTIKVDGVESPVVTIKNGQEPPAVEITNDYKLHRGDFGVVKTVDADEASSVDSNKVFSFTYECTNSINAAVTSGSVNGVKADGVVVAAGVQLPVDSTCTVTEEVDSAQVDGHTVATEDPKTVTIGHNTVVEAKFVNTYTRDMGSFALIKKVAGLDGAARDFKFTYNCEAAGSGELTVKGDGRAVASGVQVPTGTKCTVKEDAAAAKFEGYSLRSAGEVTFTVESKSQVVDVEFTNTYTPEPKPGKLSNTGASVTGLIGGGAVMLILGVAALAIRRKRDS